MVDILATIEEAEEINVTIEGGIGATNFTGLLDTPSVYTDDALKIVRVNADEDGLEFSTSTVSWGGIGGTLSDQTDLQAALDAKEEDLTFSTGLTRTINTITVNNSELSISASQVTDFDTEVANNTAVSLNTDKVTNATHTGDVTGATALTIGVDKVLDSHINWGTGATQVNTADIPESTNLYYTEARVSANTTVTSKITGPTSAVDNALVTFDSTTGKIAKDSGLICEADKIYQEGYATSYIKFNNGIIEIWAGGQIQASWN